MNKSQLIQSLKQKNFPKHILDAFKEVKRENFVASELEKYAYDDRPLPLGFGQTISQPYTIAVMLDMLQLKPNQKVLEVGSGCGYVLALLSTITKQKIYGIEISKKLAEKSKENLKQYNTEVYNKNGAKGLPEAAPFDRILISAACKTIPEELLNQLRGGGILVAPVGPQYTQSLVGIKRIEDKYIVQKQIPGFIFVKFID